MKVDLGIICRGIGTCCIELLVSGILSQNKIKIIACLTNGNELPLELREDKWQIQGARRMICKIPYFKNANFKLICEELDTQGRCVSKTDVSLSSARIKWASRINYRLNRVKTIEVREICGRADYRLPSIQPNCYLRNGAPHPSNGPEYLLKTLIRIPDLKGSTRLMLLNDSGECVQEQEISSADYRPCLTLWGKSVYEVGFTIRIPDNHKTYCIVAKEENGIIGFLNIDDEMRRVLTTNADSRFYKVHDIAHYHEALTEAKLGLQGVEIIADPDLDVGLFSIVVPLYNTPSRFFVEMLQSVLDQTYSNWELVLVNASPENQEMKEILVRFDDARVRTIEIAENHGIAGNTNIGIKAATGDYIFLLDHDDFIDPWALYMYAQAIANDPSIDILYCDEDFYSDKDGFNSPHFKSDFNIDLLRVHNYITHFLAMRASLMKELLIDPDFDGAQDYDLLLRAVEQTQAVFHIPQILYHWRMHSCSTAQNSDAKPQANENGRRALQAHLERCGLPAQVYLTEFPCFYNAIYEVQGSPLVSIIIPNKDNADTLMRCIVSIEEMSTYPNYEIIIVENNSIEPLTFNLYENLQTLYSNIKVVTWEHEFNYSEINNYGSQFANGEYLLLLNNDTEIISANWIESMLSICQRSNVGVVGAKLLYPDNTVQHAGVVMMRGDGPLDVGGPCHIFAHLDRFDPGYVCRAIVKQDLSAVTGACLMTKRDLYRELGGLDESFAVAYNDIDYCLRVRARGFLVVYNPDALLYHYESTTRGYDLPTVNEQRYIHFLAEQGALRERWTEYYINGDPYHSKYCNLYWPI